MSDASADKSLIISDLDWVLTINKWFSDQDLLNLLAPSTAISELKTLEIGFTELKYSGKSLGSCFLTFNTEEACIAAKEFLESRYVLRQLCPKSSLTLVRDSKARLNFLNY